MKRVALFTLALLILASVAYSQVVQYPPQQGVTITACAFNNVLPTLNSGQQGVIQCGQGGQLVVIGVEQPDVNGTFTNATQTTNVTSTSQDGYGTALISINGTYGTASGVFEMSDDGGTTYYPISIARVDGSGSEVGYTSLTNVSRAWVIPVAGMDLIRIRSTAVASGTVNAKISSTSVQTSPIPTIQTSISGNAAGTTGAVVGTLAAAASKVTYICGFNVSAIGGTAAVGPITVAGLVGSSQVYQASATAAGVTLQQNFTPCIPASAPNTAITTTTTADGTATAVNVNSWGYQQ